MHNLQTPYVFVYYFLPCDLTRGIRGLDCDLIFRDRAKQMLDWVVEMGGLDIYLLIEAETYHPQVRKQYVSADTLSDTLCSNFG